MKYSKTIQTVLFMLLVWIMSSAIIYAEGIVDVSKTGWNGDIKTIISFSSTGDLLGTAMELLYDIVRFARLVLNGIALLAMLYVGFLWVTSMGNEEKTSDGKNRIMLVVLWLFIINVPEVLYRIFTGSEYYDHGFRTKVSQVGSQLSTSWHAISISENSADRCNFLFCPQNFWWTSVDSIIPILEVVMLVVAVVMFTIGGFRMLIWGGESASETAKKRLGYGVIALLITGFLEMIYRAIFFQTNLNNVAKGVIAILTKGAQFFMYLAGPIAIFYIIIGGYYFITSWGDEERTDKGKKILMYTFFATVMLLLGYTFLIEIVGLSLF